MVFLQARKNKGDDDKYCRGIVCALAEAHNKESKQWTSKRRAFSVKELPYFKFSPAEWLAGDINYLPADAQGVFISACVHYWARGCSLTIAELKQRHSKDIADLVLLLAKNGIVILDGENISIKFLDDQLKEYETLHSKRAEAGKTGSMKRWQNHSKAIANHSKAIAKYSNIDIDIDIDKDINPLAPLGDESLDSKKSGRRVLEGTFRDTLNELYHHRPTTEWSDKARRKLADILKREDAAEELAEIKALYDSGYKYYRRDITTLLNNWVEEVERARIKGFGKISNGGKEHGAE